MSIRPAVRRRIAPSLTLLFRRAGLRCILSFYTGYPPKALRFRSNAHSKPSVNAIGHRRPFKFSLSHSEDLALVAVGRDPIGVDVEHLKAQRDWQSLAPQVLTERERAELAGTPIEHRWRRFYQLWTCKEAYMKGRGLGLSLPPQSFSVVLGEMATRYDVEVDLAWHDGQRWHVYGRDASRLRSGPRLYVCTATLSLVSTCDSP